MARRSKTPPWALVQAFYVNTGMFDVDVAFCINTDSKQTSAYLKKVGPERFPLLFEDHMVADFDERPETLARMIPYGGGFIVRLKADGKDFRKFIGTLVHEIVHVAQYLLRNRGIQATPETDEVYAYLVDHLTTEALRKLY